MSREDLHDHEVVELAARWRGDAFRAAATDDLITPALVVDGDAVEHNIATVVQHFAGPDRWRPHVKTVKLPWVIETLLAHGVRRFKCATTLELRMLIDAGAPDVLFAMTARGANARAVRALADGGATTVSVLVEGESDLVDWDGAQVGVFVDVDTGLGRTGVPVAETEPIIAVARAATERGLRFAGLHAYEGDAGSAGRVANGLGGLAAVANALERAGLPAGEVVTSGSFSAGWAAGEHVLASTVPLHSLSPGTVVFHDVRSELRSPWQLGLRPAAAVLTRVVSAARAEQVTCDAGHKAVSADMGDPIGVVAGRPALRPLHPSEEHLPLAVTDGGARPSRGDILAVVPRHVCPTVNLHDAALLVRDGRAPERLEVTARGHQ
jgi:D-serine deaminase-like pyridoxal phosphate-dependent protein